MSKDTQVETEASARENTINTLTELAKKLSLPPEQGGIENEEQREKTKEEIENLLQPLSEEERSAILWESLRQRALDFLTNALVVLEGEQARNLYLSGQKTPEQYFSEITCPRAFVEIIHRIIYYDPIFSGIAPILKGPVATYPYDSILMEENPRIANVLANIGHDITHLPAFLRRVYELPVRAQKGKLTEKEKDFFYHLLPHLYQGVVWDFEFFLQQLEEIFPIAEANLENILRVVAAEGAVRASYGGVSLILNKLAISTTKIEGEKNFEIKARIAKGLTLTGNEAALHFLFYQIIKNSVVLLDETESVKEGEISIDAKVCTVDGHRVVAVRIEDNGPGIDITSVLRAKQRLLQEDLNAGKQLTAQEQQIPSDWACLGLRIIDVVNFIFESRVSGRKGHGGIGLAMVKEIIEKHGGYVWVTNHAGRPGAKFLVLLPSADGSLREKLSQLFQTETIPVEILESIDRQLSEE